MTKARTLGNFVSTGNPLSDGTIAASEVTGLATVATSGSYNDLSNKPTITTTATNIAGGSNGTIPYQSAADTTQMLAAGTSGYFLKSNGVAAPSWDAVPATTPAGSTGQLQYNNAGAFAAVSAGTSGQLLTSAGAGAVPTWTTPAAGGGTVTMTSSGAITAGLGVIVNSDGTGSVPVVTRTITSLGPERLVTSNEEPNQMTSMIYCASFGV